jgi:hypothetical protein
MTKSVVAQLDLFYIVIDRPVEDFFLYRFPCRVLPTAVYGCVGFKAAIFVKTQHCIQIRVVQLCSRFKEFNLKGESTTVEETRISNWWIVKSERPLTGSFTALQAKHPLVFMPGVVTGGLELWEGQECAEDLFRQRVWGGDFADKVLSKWDFML